MWPRKRIDIGWGDLAYGLVQCGLPQRQDRAVSQLERFWAPEGDGLAFLSVRSGFDLLLTALALPRGSEVIVSSVTIRDMARILEEHGLVAVPVDLDVDRMAPNMARLENTVTPRTRAVLVAHLFGGLVDLEPILALARRHDLLVIEDCAQAFSRPEDRGHPDADVSMFSFGSIKTATALGGALFRVRSAELRSLLRERHAAWPVQRRASYVTRVLKYGMLRWLGQRQLYSMFVWACGALGRDYDQIVNDAVRGFAGPDFFERIRRRPSAAVLSVLRRRLARFDRHRLADRARKGALLAGLVDDVAPCPGIAAQRHTHWVFPILSDDPTGTIERLREAGFDATQGQSMICIPAPTDRPETASVAAPECLRRLVYLPLYPDLPDDAILQMADALAHPTAALSAAGTEAQIPVGAE